MFDINELYASRLEIIAARDKALLDGRLGLASEISDKLVVLERIIRQFGGRIK